MFYGGIISTANKSCLNGSFTPFEAFSIDQKIDDGAYIASAATGARSGNFRSLNSASGTCLSGGNYAVNTETEVCVSGLAMSD